MAGILAIGSRFDGGDAFLAAGPFAGQQQGQREQAAQHRAHAGAEQAGLDRIAHHEEAAERQRQPADPHHPAGADRFPRSRDRAAAVAAAVPPAPPRPARGVSGAAAGATGSASGTMGGGAARPRRGRRQGSLERFKWRERWRHGRAAAAGAAWIASSRLRNSATSFMAFRAKTRATIAIASAKKIERGRRTSGLQAGASDR